MNTRPTYQPHPKPKPMTDKERRKKQNGHLFIIGKGHVRMGGRCACGLTKMTYTTRLCTGKPIPQCQKSKTGRTAKPKPR